LLDGLAKNTRFTVSLFVADSTSTTGAFPGYSLLDSANFKTTIGGVIQMGAVRASGCSLSWVGEPLSTYRIVDKNTRTELVRDTQGGSTAALKNLSPGIQYT